MKQLLALLLFLPSLCLAQVPTSVPMDGLVAWYGFNADAQDSGPNSWHGTVHGSPEFVVDRFGNAGQALQLSHNGQYVSMSNWFSSTPNQTEWTMSIWFKRSPESSTYPDFLIGHRGHFRDKYINGGAIALSGQSRINTATHLSTAYAPDNFEDDWHSIVFRSTLDSLELYFDGVHVSGTERQGITDDWTTNYHGTFIGGNGHDPEWAGTFEGTVDDAGVWSRALNPDEISFLVLGAEAVHGCTDQTACNYDEEANVENGSCEYGCLYCGEGTYWDSTLQECIAVIPSADSILVPIPSCGPGTVWDPVNEECIIAVPTDNDLDGCISASDVLNLLSTFGTCPPIPFSGPCQGLDHVTYHGYDYGIVEIGEQCWFAENLRNAQFRNGEAISGELNGAAWASTDEAAQTIYGEGANACFYGNCDPTVNLANYGRLYNGHAVQDVRGLCPTGWNVPTDNDWMALETHMGMNPDDLEETGWRPVAMGSLKASPSDSPGWNGTNDYGFTGLPGGARNQNDGHFYNGDHSGTFWGGDACLRSLGTTDGLERAINVGPRIGASVRCLKD